MGKEPLRCICLKSMTEVLLPAHGRRHRVPSSAELTTLEKRHRLHALTVVPIPYRSAYGLYVYMSSLTVKTSQTRNVETKICHLRSPRITIDYQNGENDVHDHSKSSTPTSPHTVWHCLVTISRLCPASLCTHHR